MRSFVAGLIAVAVVATACAEDVQPTTAPTETVASAADPTTVPTAPPASTTAVTTLPATTAPPTTTTVPLIPLDELELALEVVADGFAQPVFLASPPNDPRLFVLDQPGRVWVIDGGDPEVFLDIRDQVRFRGEQGLLGLAFAPDFATTQLLYLDYTSNSGSTRVAEFVGSDEASERIMLEIAQPASNHNGGTVAFGPDGYLWIGMGDGGSRDDRFGNGQDGRTLLGSLLRIDPSSPGGDYAIPPSNPGAGGDGDVAPEVWAIGMRNPWRFSFDGTELWIGDVGQDRWEEIDRIDISQANLPNFGWPFFEGSQCYLSDCDTTGLTVPVYDYDHGEGCSVTGGYVYRGPSIPELHGHYFFGDFCGGWIRSLTPDGDVIEWFEPSTVAGHSSFGVDAAGELYITSTDGTLYRLTALAP